MIKDENWGDDAVRRTPRNGSAKVEDWLLDGMKPAPSNGSAPRPASTNGAPPKAPEAPRAPRPLRRVPLPEPRETPTPTAAEDRIDAALAAFAGQASRVEANVRRAQDRVALAARRITDLDL